MNPALADAINPEHHPDHGHAVSTLVMPDHSLVTATDVGFLAAAAQHVLTMYGEVIAMHDERKAG